MRLCGRKSVTVLQFHKVPEQTDALEPSEVDLLQFERTLSFLIERFRVLPLAHVVDNLLVGKVPKNTICLTFDDGYIDWMHGVVPILLRWNVHATFYVTTGQFTGAPMWHERVNNAIRTYDSALLNVRDIHPSALPTHSLSDRRLTVQVLQHYLKYQTLFNRNQMLETLERACGVDSSNLPVMPCTDLRLIHSKGFDIGAHSINHPILSFTSDSEAYEEISASREQLENLIGGRIDSFAYPNGNPGTDFTSTHVAMVKRAGYRFAVTTQRGALRQTSSLFQVPRFTPWGPDHLRMSWQVIRNQNKKSYSLDES
jgi:peptidoglycan/xylan/chitin deacetylase (PgdA/CDA1 family)